MKIAKDDTRATSTVDLTVPTFVLAMSFFVTLESNNRTTDAVMKETIVITINTLAHGRE